MTTTVIPQIGGLSQVGLAVETTPGTFRAPTSLMPFTECSIDPDPGLFYPSAIIGYRDTQTWPLYGQYKFKGSLASALFPTNGSPLFAGAIATDNLVGYGVTGSGAVETQAIVGASPGATTVTTSTSPGVDYIIGAVVQIDVNNPVTPTTSECRKLLNVVGDQLTLDAPLNFAHASSCPISVVVAPYTHTLIPTPTLPSLSVSKKVGNSQAEQWAGCKIGKYTVKCQATNTAVDITADVVAQTVTINDNPTFIPVIDEPPLEWVGLTMTYNSLQLLQANNLNLAIDNKLMEDYTFDELHTVGYLTPAGLIANGSFDVIYNSLDDTDFGFFDQILNNQVSTTLDLSFAGPNGALIDFNMTKVNLGMYKDAIKEGDTIKTTLNFEAALNLEASPPNTIKVLITDLQYLPF